MVFELLSQNMVGDLLLNWHFVNIIVWKKKEFDHHITSPSVTWERKKVYN